MLRCVNDIFGYCNGQPDYSEKPYEQQARNGLTFKPTGSYAGGKCRREPKTCGYFLSWGQVSNELPARK